MGLGQINCNYLDLSDILQFRGRISYIATMGLGYIYCNCVVVLDILQLWDWVREGLKKNGLFSDIDQISFDTHLPPPKDDIRKRDYVL